MEAWAERKAEKLPDAFLTYEGPGDLLQLQEALLPSSAGPMKMVSSA
jgi:hypothetical protein